jgi:hypothetical protein
VVALCPACDHVATTLAAWRNCRAHLGVFEAPPAPPNFTHDELEAMWHALPQQDATQTALSKLADYIKRHRAARGDNVLL